MRILIYIESLDTGGAEWQSFLLARELAHRQHDVYLVCNYPQGKFWEMARACKQFRTVSLFRSGDVPRLLRMLNRLLAPFKLTKLVNKQRSQLLYSSLYLSNLTMLVASRLAGVRPLTIWSLRITKQVFRGSEIIWFRLCKYFSGAVDVIASNSVAGLDHHKSAGYSLNNTLLLRNILDTPGLNLRKQASTGKPMRYGVLGRIAPQKNLQHAIRSFADIADELPGASLKIAGPVRDGSYLHSLQTLISDLGMERKINLMPEEVSPIEFYNDIDVLISCSVSEGFSNVIAEAMYLDMTCIATDVGDSRLLVGKSGIVLPANDIGALSQGIRDLSSGRLARIESPADRISRLCNKQNTLEELERKISTLLG